MSRLKNNNIFGYVYKFRNLLLFAFAICWYLPIFYSGVDNDSSRFLNISYFKESWQLEYWWSVFTSPVNFNQYRPLSFFAIYHWFGGKTYEDFPMIYPSLGILLFLMSYVNFTKILQNLSISKLLTTVFSLLYLIQISHVGLYSYSFSVKYYFPLFTLTYIIRLLSLNREFTKIELIKFFILISLSILSHEASFTFPFLLLLLLKRMKLRSIFPLFIPSLAYLIMRIFIFGIPTSGAMGVDIYKILIPLSYYLNAIITYYIAPDLNVLTYTGTFIWAGVITFGISLLFSFLHFRYKKDHRPLLALFSILILISPFCLIPKHVFFTRIIWVQFVYLLFMAMILNSSYVKKWIKLTFITTYLTIALVNSYNFHKEYENRLQFHTIMKEEIKSLVSSFNKNNFNEIIFTEEDLNQFYPFTLGILREAIQELDLKRTIYFSFKTATEIKKHLIINSKTYFLIKNCDLNNCLIEDPYHFKREKRIPQTYISEDVDLRKLYETSHHRAYKE
jgi:hypothetical protein